MGIDDEIPLDKIFENKRKEQVLVVDAARYSSYIDNYFYSDSSLTRIERAFQPTKDDVIFASNPR